MLFVLLVYPTVMEDGIVAAVAPNSSEKAVAEISAHVQQFRPCMPCVRSTPYLGIQMRLALFYKSVAKKEGHRLLATTQLRLATPLLILMLGLDSRQLQFKVLFSSL